MNIKSQKIIATCPHCLNTLGNEYPQFGGNYELIHHSQFISSLIKEGKINPLQTVEGKITYHDPCYLGRYNNVYDEPRNVIGALAKEGLTEMPRHREESFCCGAGGARMWMEETIGSRININRVTEAVDLGADVGIILIGKGITELSGALAALGTSSQYIADDASLERTTSGVVCALVVDAAQQFGADQVWFSSSEAAKGAAPPGRGTIGGRLLYRHTGP